MESQSQGAAQSRREHGFGLAGIGAAVGILVAVAGGGFKTGLIYAEADAKVQSVGLREANSKWQAALTIEQAKVSDLATRLAESKAVHKEALAEINSQRVQMQGLLEQTRKLDNCAFIREQIVALQRGIDNPYVIRTIGVRGEETVEKAALEQRLSNYQQQLANCQR